MFSRVRRNEGVMVWFFFQLFFLSDLYQAMFTWYSRDHLSFKRRVIITDYCPHANSYYLHIWFIYVFLNEYYLTLRTNFHQIAICNDWMWVCFVNLKCVEWFRCQEDETKYSGNDNHLRLKSIIQREYFYSRNFTGCARNLFYSVNNHLFGTTLIGRATSQFYNVRVQFDGIERVFKRE